MVGSNKSLNDNVLIVLVFLHLDFNSLLARLIQNVLPKVVLKTLHTLGTVPVYSPDQANCAFIRHPCSRLLTFGLKPGNSSSSEGGVRLLRPREHSGIYIQGAQRKCRSWNRLWEGWGPDVRLLLSAKDFTKWTRQHILWAGVLVVIFMGPVNWCKLKYASPWLSFDLN